MKWTTSARYTVEREQMTATREDIEETIEKQHQWDAESNLASADWVGLPGSAAGSGDK
jgi:hypothetical protein